MLYFGRCPETTRESPFWYQEDMNLFLLMTRNVLKCEMNVKLFGKVRGCSGYQSQIVSILTALPAHSVLLES